MTHVQRSVHTSPPSGLRKRTVARPAGGRRSGEIARALLLASALALAAGIPHPAAGQTDTLPTAAAMSDTLPPIPLDPVVVRVLRTPVELTTLPFAVSVLGRRELREAGTGLFLEEALAGLPGIEVQNRFNYAVGERISIRGFGARAQFGVRGIQVMVDGIPATLPDGQATLDHLDLGSVGRVEVLRGPAAAHYGNGAGGVLAFRTVPPAAAPLRQEAELVAGSHDLSRLQSVSSGTVGRTGYVLSLSRLGYDGFRTDPLSEGEVYGQARRLHLNGRLVRPLGPGELSVSVNAAELDAENPGSLSDSLLALGDRQAFRFNVLQGTRKSLWQGQAGASWRGPVGDLDAELALHGIVRDLENPIPPAVVDLERRAGGVRGHLEGEVALGSLPLRWLAGGEVRLQQDDRLNFENEGGETGILTLDQEERVRNAGLFLQSTAQPVRDVDVLAALRYDRVRFEMDDRFPTADDPDDSGSRTLDAWSPSLGIHWQAVPAVGLYASVATSFETPTTTELVNRPEGAGGLNPELAPREGTTLELGGRGRIGDGTGYELTLYRTDLTGELVPFEAPDQPGRTFFRNAGTSRHQGAEAVVWGTHPAGLRGRVTYTWTDAVFRTYVVDGEDLSGQRIPGVAPQSVQAVVDAERSGWLLGLVGQWRDRVPADDRNEAHAPSHWLMDLRGRTAPLSVGDVELRAFGGVSNLLDETYVAAVAVNAFGGRYFEPGPPRAFHLGLRAVWAGR